MKKIRVVYTGLKDISKGIRIGMIGTLVEVLEGGALLVNIPIVGDVTLFANQVAYVD